MHKLSDKAIHVAVENLKKFYPTVVEKDFDTIDSAYLMDQFVKQNLQPNTFEKKAIVLKREETYFLLEESKVPIQFLNLIAVFKNNHIWNCDFYIISGWENTLQNISTYLNTNSYGYNFYHIDTKTLICKNFSESVENFDLNVAKIKYNICSLQVCHRVHRKLWAKFLLRNKFIDDNIISIRAYSEISQEAQNIYSNYLKENTSEEKNYISHPIWNNQEGFFMNDELKKLWDTEDLIFKKHELVDDNFDKASLDFIQHAGVVFANETLFHNSYVYLTEKVGQAILTKRPFVIIGVHGSLQYLKDLGYYTFEDLIDPSYDQMTNVNDRMEALMTLALQIKSWPLEKITNYIEKNKDKLEYNYQHMMAGKKNLESNVKNAIIDICQ